MLKVQGCQAKCPLCFGLCDIEHWLIPDFAAGSDENKHCCNLGHKLLAFTGIKLESDGSACLLSCDMIPNH